MEIGVLFILVLQKLVPIVILWEVGNFWCVVIVVLSIITIVRGFVLICVVIDRISLVVASSLVHTG